MFMASTMVCVYLCLLIRTFESKSQESKEDESRNLKISKVEITKKNHLSFPRLASPVFTIAGATARSEERPVRVS